MAVNQAKIAAELQKLIDIQRDFLAIASPQYWHVRGLDQSWENFRLLVIDELQRDFPRSAEELSQ